MVADVADDVAEETVAGIVATGGEAEFVHADVSRAADVEAMIAATVERFGGLTVLFNNAGVFLQGDDSVLTTPEDVWDRVIAINLKSVFLGCQYGIPAMLASGGGAIVNMASFVALMGAATPQIAYTASKGGVLAMTREIAVEFARKGIRANALCPGPVETPCFAPCSATSRSGSAGWCTSPWGGSAGPRRSRTERCSSPRTSRRS